MSVLRAEKRERTDKKKKKIQENLRVLEIFSIASERIFQTRIRKTPYKGHSDTKFFFLHKKKKRKEKKSL